MKYFSCTTFHLLTSRSKKRILWITERLLELNPECNGELLLGLVKNIVPSDTGDENTFLVNQVSTIIQNNEEKIVNNKLLSCYITLPILRLLAEECLPPQTEFILRRLAFRLLSEHWDMIHHLGRELVRALVECYHIPEIGKFWQYLLSKNSRKSFENILKTTCSIKFIALQLPPHIEKNMFWFLDKSDELRDCQALFSAVLAKKIIPSHTLSIGTYVSDLIRFLCHQDIKHSSHHKCVLILEMLRHVKTSFSLAICKMALFMDIFGPDQAARSEILGDALIHFCLTRQPKISASLTEFRTKFSKEFLNN